MSDLIRDSIFGQLVRLLTPKLKYPEEKEGFQLPWLRAVDDDDTAVEKDVMVFAEDSNAEQEKGPRLDLIVKSKSNVEAEAKEAYDVLMHVETQVNVLDFSYYGPTEADALSHVMSRHETRPWSVERFETEKEDAVKRRVTTIIQPQRTHDGVVLVDWYTTDDPENPQNWSSKKKNYVTAQIFFYTFVVYSASSIYTPAEQGVMEAFGVGIPKAALGLSVYVLGYGVGPLFFSPMSEIPLFGRNIPYMSSFGLFVIMAIPTALVRNYAGLLVLRFITGFLGSPCLATGGASMQDLYSFPKLPYALCAWVSAAFSAPALGPAISAFAVTAEGWRWALWEILWMSAPVYIIMFFTFPETSSANILLRRARRVRALTGDQNYRSQSEIDQQGLSLSKVAQDALLKPLKIMVLDPAVLFTNLYTSLIYGIYYSFFEAFPLVYIGIYGFNLGEMALVFICTVVGCCIGIVTYCSYIYFYQEPDMLKNGMRSQEHRLIPALFASVALPSGLFIFAWTAREDIHWIVSVIGITIFATGAFVLLQCIFMYLPLSYPQYAASLFAANDTSRSALAAAAIIYAHPLFVNLGIGSGVSVLGGLAVGGIVGIWLLWIYGGNLRARSKFAQSS